jgi:uncharacterized protein (TIGR00661 family)
LKPYSQKINSGPAKTGKTGGKPRILVAPLDWGLGHTTRCIPIIRELLAQDADVYLAGNQRQAALFAEEFPSLPLLPLDGYNIRYGASAGSLFRSMVVQAPKIMRSIRNEQAWLKSTVHEYSIDAVISDNRYGLHHPGIPCIFLTHQLAIKTPLGKWAEGLIQKKNYGYINRFTACWVPDQENGENLAGDLSHPPKKPAIPVKYIGPLSRFQPIDLPQRKHHLLFILSGPEPQRTILENRIISEAVQYPGTATIVRGLPDEEKIIPSTNMIMFYNHLPAAALNREMMQADYIISRSGYSTVMDLAALGKKSILIPTPGQTEQEYLGKYLQEKKFAMCILQKQFSLESALQLANKFSYRIPVPPEHGALRSLVTALMHQLA